MQTCSSSKFWRYLYRLDVDEYNSQQWIIVVANLIGLLHMMQRDSQHFQEAILVALLTRAFTDHVCLVSSSGPNNKELNRIHIRKRMCQSRYVIMPASSQVFLKIEGFKVVEAQIEDVKLHDNENLLSFDRVTFKKCLCSMNFWMACIFKRKYASKDHWEILLMNRNVTLLLK